VRPNVLIDARMRKPAHPESHLGLPELTIGLGPKFVAGQTTDLIVETAWGDGLRRVSNHGASTEILPGTPQYAAVQQRGIEAAARVCVRRFRAEQAANLARQTGSTGPFSQQRDGGP